MSTPTPEFRHDIAEAALALPVAAALGFTFTHLAGGHAETHLPWRSDLSHTPGAFQANPIAALADFTGVSAGLTLLPAGSTAATADYTVKFLAEARGTLLIACGHVLRAGATLTVAAVDLYATGHDRDTTLSATALITMRNTLAHD